MEEIPFPSSPPPLYPQHRAAFGPKYGVITQNVDGSEPAAMLVAPDWNGMLTGDVEVLL